MKKVLEGWLAGDYDEISIFKTKDDAENRFYTAHAHSIDVLLKEFKGVKIRLTIEKIDNE